MTLIRRLRRAALLWLLPVLAAPLTGMAASAAETTTSDDFNAGELDTQLWTHLDPLGDTSVSMTGSQAVISIPAGVAHDLWTGRLHSPRLLQSAPDGDFQVEIKFDSTIQAGQLQGLVVHQDPENLLRLEVHDNGKATKLYVATIVDGSGAQLTATKLADGAPFYLRLTRAGDQWTLDYSQDGTTWTAQLTFTHSLVVSSIGPHAGTFGKSPPAFDAAIDYFLAISSSGGSDGGSEDTTAPVLSDVSAQADATSAAITWTTDEPATSTVAYGLTTAYENGTVDDIQLVTSHTLTLAGLTCETAYHYQARSADPAGNLGTAPDAIFTTTACTTGDSGPVINVWYGDSHSFGEPGMAQQWVNVLGNVSDPDGIGSLSYALNDGDSSWLSVGPDGKRLVALGDFNAEIDHRQPSPGSNAVTLTATDALGNLSVRTVTVNHTAGQTWPLPYTTDWAATARIGDAAQIVDGLWALQADHVRTSRVGYDRLVALGDTAWTEYEVTVPVTINALREDRQAAVGVLVGWTGHTGKAQPRTNVGYGAVAWYQKFDQGPYRLQIRRKGTVLAEDVSGLTLELGTPYVFKFRMDRLPDGTASYSLKVWQDGTQEPSNWNLTGTAGARAGSALLVAHFIDATFGDVTIAPLPA